MKYEFTTNRESLNQFLYLHSIRNCNFSSFRNLKGATASVKLICKTVLFLAYVCAENSTVLENRLANKNKKNTKVFNVSPVDDCTGKQGLRASQW